MSRFRRAVVRHDGDMAVSTIQPVRGARSALSPTARTTLNRRPDRGSAERQDLYDVLDAALICHFGVVIDGSPVVLPTAFGFDPDGPDEGGTLYLHGSVASKSLQDEPQSNVCVTFTVLDGLVLARTGFHHSMNYRCAVVMGRTRKVTDPEEKVRALNLVVDHAVPGRARTLRPHSRKELAATVVLAMPLVEASVKARSGDPVDDAVDLEAGGWAGVVGLRLAATGIHTAADAHGHEPPADVRARAANLI